MNLRSGHGSTSAGLQRDLVPVPSEGQGGSGHGADSDAHEDSNEVPPLEPMGAPPPPPPAATTISFLD